MSKKRIIILCVILAAAVALFIFRSGGKKDVVAPVTSSGVIDADNNLGRDFISALIGVERVALDTSLLNSPVFQSLVPSGAYVDPNPSKGKSDPFTLSGDVSTETIVDDAPVKEVIVPTRGNDLGMGGIANNIANAVISVTKITKSTASVAVSGLPQGLTVTVTLNDSGNTATPLILTYKDTAEYNAIATGLKAATSYIVKIKTPDTYTGLQTTFSTK